MRHAITRPIAKAALGPSKPGEGVGKEQPHFAELFVDEDRTYRWYCDELPTDAAAPTLRRAIAAGLVQWPTLEITEIRGEAVVWFEHEQFEDSAAADEISSSKASPPNPPSQARPRRSVRRDPLTRPAKP